MSAKKFMARIFIAILLVVLPGNAVVGAFEKKFPSLDTASLVYMLGEQEQQGKVVIISVFASWCPPCRKEMPILVSMHNRIAPENLMLIGISVDEKVSALNNFIEEYKINFPVFVPTNDLVGELELAAIPRTLVFDRKGELGENFEGVMPEAKFNELIAGLLEQRDE